MAVLLAFERFERNYARINSFAVDRLPPRSRALVNRNVRLWFVQWSRRRSAGGITRSVSESTAHDGIVFQPGAGALSLSALAASGRCVADMTIDCDLGRPDANTDSKAC